MKITANAHDLLAERGLIAQTTDDGLRDRLVPGKPPVVVYNGFDPTADSLHVGHFVPIMGLAWLQRCGHKPIAVVGGATALVGDPSGKSEARRMLTPEQVAHNAEGLKAQLARFIRFGDGPSDGLLLNNADWLADKGWIQMLREVGPHFSVNRMLTMDSVKGRMTPSGEGAGSSGGGGGISFIEFNYMVMQAYDYLHLYRTHGCTLQTGGQDQWGNIVMGLELIRRVGHKASSDNPLTASSDPGEAAAGLTFPLVTKSDGTKFGKTESGAVWLDPDRTSPYDFFQFFRNTADADVGRYLGYFTFLPIERVRELASRQGRELNGAKEVLAYEVTKLVHGEAEAEAARDSARRAFAGSESAGGSDVTGEAIPHASLGADELPVGLLALLVRAKLASSNGEARRLVQAGGVRLHDEAVSDPTRQVDASDIRDGYIVLRAGKKRLFRFDIAAKGD